mgnify:CR=1 FL=1
MDEFDEGITGRGPTTESSRHGVAHDTDEGLIQASDAHGLVAITARAGRIESVQVQERGVEQPELLGRAIAEATNAILEKLDAHRETIRSAPDIASFYQQVHEHNKASQKQFDRALEEIDGVQKTLDAQLAGLHDLQMRNFPDGQPR